MANTGRNEGFHVLEDFPCEAIRGAVIPLAKPENLGMNEGMLVIEELVFDATSEGKSDANEGASPS